MSCKFAATNLITLLCLIGCIAETPSPATAVTRNDVTGSDSVQPDASSSDDAFQLSNFRWMGPLDGSATVRVYNPYGDIRSRASGEDKLIVSAQIQSFTDWQAKPEFEVADVDGITVVRISHQHPGRAMPGGDYQTGLAGRVDITLLLPDGVHFDARTTDGAIRVKSFKGTLQAESESGEIYYKSHGSLDLRNDSGNIDAVLRSFDADDAAVFHTGSGDIAVRMTPEVSAVVNVSSNGKIDTAIIDAVVQHRTRGKNAMNLLLGKAQRAIEVHSDSGNVLIAVDRSYSVDQADD